MYPVVFLLYFPCAAVILVASLSLMVQFHCCIKKQERQVHCIILFFLPITSKVIKSLNIFYSVRMNTLCEDYVFCLSATH